MINNGGIIKHLSWVLGALQGNYKHFIAKKKKKGEVEVEVRYEETSMVYLNIKFF